MKIRKSEVKNAIRKILEEGAHSKHSFLVPGAKLGKLYSDVHHLFEEYDAFLKEIEQKDGEQVAIREAKYMGSLISNVISDVKYLKAMKSELV